MNQQSEKRTEVKRKLGIDQDQTPQPQSGKKPTNITPVAGSTRLGKVVRGAKRVAKNLGYIAGVTDKRDTSEEVSLKKKLSTVSEKVAKGVINQEVEDHKKKQKQKKIDRDYGKVTRGKTSGSGVVEEEKVRIMKKGYKFRKRF